MTNEAIPLANYKKELAEFLAHKSISTDASFRDDIQRCVKWIENFGISQGATVSFLDVSETNPVVVLKWEVSKETETVLVYGHYDVQPVDECDAWHADPFTLHEEGGKLFARGVVDNKGQVLIHLMAVSHLYASNLLKKNVTFVIEGNEESGNHELAGLLEKHKAELACDKILVSDGQIVAGHPTVELGLRGGGNLVVELTTSHTNLHSGIFGGAVPNAAFTLSQILSKLYDADNRIAVPGFYDKVREIKAETKDNNEKLCSIDSTFLDRAGVSAFACEPGVDPYTQVGLRPTIQITGLVSGYTGKGFANIVPCKAEVRLNLRLVADQCPEESVQQVVGFLEEHTPDFAKLSYKDESVVSAVRMDHADAELSQVKELLEQSFSKPCYFQFCGGGIPIVQDMQAIFGVNPLLVSLGNDDCNMHGVNENFDIHLVEAGLRFSVAYFSL